MPINLRRRLSRDANSPGPQRPFERRLSRIAEVFEDLATESVVELIVYEDFLDLNPQVREFPNLSSGDIIVSNEIRVSSGDSDFTNTNNRQNINGIYRKTSRRDFLRRFRARS